MSDILGAMGIDSGIITLILLVLTVILLISVISNNMRLTRLEHRYKQFMKGSEGQSLEKEFTRKFAQIDRLFEAKEDHENDLRTIKDNFQRIYSKYGYVKYDAFDDVGGKLSFALAMLDQTDTGFVLNAIHSKENCFLYIKEVMNGESYIILSDEEIQALRIARKYGDDADV